MTTFDELALLHVMLTRSTRTTETGCARCQRRELLQNDQSLKPRPRPSALSTRINTALSLLCFPPSSLNILSVFQKSGLRVQCASCASKVTIYSLHVLRLPRSGALSPKAKPKRKHVSARAALACFTCRIKKFSSKTSCPGCVRF
jgi:hypothetical protein